jgi:glycosyltransferase involved in cell wall biosynthesis
MVNLMEIDYINGPKTDKIFGMSKYQREIIKRLNIELNVVEYDSLTHYFGKKYSDDPKSLKGSSDSVDSSFNNYGFIKRSTNSIKNIGIKTLKTIDKYRYIRIVKNKVKQGNIKHITSQELAFLLNSVKLENNIVTCYDLIPWIYDNERSWIWKENMNGLKKADNIITISQFSRDEIVKYLNYPEDRIKIVHPAVDHGVYYEKRDKRILKKINISNNEKVVLYVGSETPRQNVPILIEAFSRIKKDIPGIKLVKIGESQSYGSRKKILTLINDLKLDDDVIFAGYVPEEELPLWYNASDILVYPCDYAGFGLPPLEAMACGTPVITSNTSSLPEVVGDAGIMIDPKDPKLMAEKMYELLTDNTISSEMIKRGLKRSRMFQWDEAAKKTLEIYENMV